MKRQLSFSPKLTTRSLDLEFTSRWKRFAATMYSARSSHSPSISWESLFLISGSFMNDSTAKICSLEMSRIMVRACSTRSCCNASSLLAAATLSSFLKISSSLAAETAWVSDSRI